MARVSDLTLGEHEVADEEHRAPHGSSSVRDLADMREVLPGTTCR